MGLGTDVAGDFPVPGMPSIKVLLSQQSLKPRHGEMWLLGPGIK